MTNGRILKRILGACLKTLSRRVKTAVPSVWCPRLSGPEARGASEEENGQREPPASLHRLPLRISAFGFLSDFGFRISDLPPLPVVRVGRLLGSVLTLADSLKAGHQPRVFKQALRGVGIAALGFASAAFAGPQHWGFGFGYLVTVEQNERGQRALSVYEPPLRVKDGAWLLRWRDTSEQYKDVIPGGIAVGNFWPQPMGKEHVVALRPGGKGIELIVLDAPESFSRQPWRMLGRSDYSSNTNDGATLCGATAGDLLGRGADQLITLQDEGSGPRLPWLRLLAPPARPDQPWSVIGKLNLYTVLGTNEVLSLAAGDFWGAGQDLLALTAKSPSGGASSEILFLRVQPRAGLELAAQIVVRAPVTAEAPTALVAADFLKDGFAYVLETARNLPELAFRTAPRLADQPFNTCWVRPGETFAGAMLGGQQVGESRPIMRGQRQAPFGNLVAAGAGRVFGYVNPGCDERKAKLFLPWKYHGYNDAEISFVHRTPMYRMGVPKKWQDDNYPWEPDDHFGWPFKGEEITYEVAIKNNHREPIPAGKVTVRAWVNRPDRNADLLGASAQGRSDETAAGGEDFTFTIPEPIPPFDPANPQYTIVPVKLKWPFDLVQPPGWTWKRLNVRDIGERWFIVRLEYAGDENQRNDRYELAENALLFRPVFRFDAGAPTEIEPAAFHNKAAKLNTLVYRAPTVSGDPESKEYSGRKLADAVQCMWERSRTSDGQDVWQRIVFDGYRKSLGIPADRDLDWSWVEAPRELDLWLGLWGDFARFNPRDGGEELHETGHLFHRIGDLYHYFIMPSGLRSIPLADGTPVQMYTYAWGLDSFCSGHAIIGEATCDLHRYIEGARYGLGWPWHQMLPAQIRVRVLDRDGQPVAAAPVGLWLYPDDRKHSAGTTDAAGLWDPGLCRRPTGANEGTPDRAEGEAAAPEFRLFEPFNLKLWKGSALDAMAHVFVVDLPGYSDFAIWGSEGTQAHSRYTLMQASLLHPAGWTWDFRTLYKRGAPAPAFNVTAAVRGSKVALGIGPADGTPPGQGLDRRTRFRVYRRWEPTYSFERIDNGQFPEPTSRLRTDGTAEQLSLDVPDQPLVFTDDLAARDWYMQGRYRAAYYVTAVTPGDAGGIESLPRRVYGIGVQRANGLADLGGGRLLVALNCGKAEPFGALFQGTTPTEEYIKHFRFGHTAAKIVPAGPAAATAGGKNAYPSRYYATLVQADLPWMPRYFDLIQFDKPDLHDRRYPVVQTISEVNVKAFSTEAPYTVTLAKPDREPRTAINPGDWATEEDTSTRILAVGASEVRGGGAGLTLTLDKPLFKPGQKSGLHLQIEFGGGSPGSRADLRELNKPRGLAVFPLDQKARSRAGSSAAEQGLPEADSPAVGLAIADTGNHRVVVWDATTRFLAAWSPPTDTAFNPAAVAPRPSQPNQFLVLDRRADRTSRVLLLDFDGQALKLLSSQPVPVGDAAGPAGPEIGLAVAPPRDDGTILLAVTDAGQRQVLELPYAPETMITVRTLQEATGTFVGTATLERPTDVAYTVENGQLRLYAVDAHDRVVRLR